MVQAGLIAADTGIDLVGTASSSLVDELGVRQERARHGDHVSRAVSQQLIGQFRGIDAVGGDQRDRDLALELGGHLGEGTTRHLGGDGRNPRFVPADTGVDDGRTGLLNRLGEHDDLIPGAAALDQIEHRQAIDDDEFRADRLAYAAHDLDRQAHAVFVAAAPAVGTLVDVGNQKLVDEVAFRAHDFDAVITRFLGQCGAAGKVGNLLFDPFLVQLLGGERVDRRLYRTGRDLLGAVGVTACVQNLHADLAAFGVHSVSDHLVLGRFFRRGHLGRAMGNAALLVRTNTTGNDKAGTPTGALGKVGRLAVETVRAFFQTGMH